MSIVKILVVSVYYLIYLTMEKWMTPLFAVSFLGVGIAGFLGEKKCFKTLKKVLFVLTVGLYVGVAVWSITSDINGNGVLGDVLQGVYYIGMLLIGYGIGNSLRNVIQEKTSEVNPAKDEFWKWIRNGCILLYIAGIVPLSMISKYVFPKADDYSFGYHAHRAWEATGSLVEVVKAAIVMIEEAYFDWQGTYTSIFLMAIQPGVFDEHLYRIVPFLFVGMLTVASYFFWKTLLIDWLHVDKVLSQICIWSYIILIIQCVPDSRSAFIWYNGAIHYIASHCAVIVMLAFLIRLYIGKYSVGSWIGAAISAIYVGGGNYVTAIGTLLIGLTILFTVTLTKSWKRFRAIISICFVYFGALLFNVAAPGNFNRKMGFEGYSIIEAFFMAFYESANHMFGKWMRWSIVVWILCLLPILWKMVGMSKLQFRYPVLVLGYSWCYMASLFFTPLYTLGEVDIGRFQNVMYIHWMTLLLIDIAYVLGWIQRKYNVEHGMSLWCNEKRYMYTVLGIALVFAGVSAMAEPGKYTATRALETYFDSGLEQYGQEYWQMVSELEKEENIVTIQDFTYIPEYFDVQLRHEGLRLFYSKDKVIIE